MAEAKGPGEVTVRQMTPEERERYPPPALSVAQVGERHEAGKTVREIAAEFGAPANRIMAMISIFKARQAGPGRTLAHVPAALTNGEPRFQERYNDVDLLLAAGGFHRKQHTPAQDELWAGLDAGDASLDDAPVRGSDDAIIKSADPMIREEACEMVATARTLTPDEVREAMRRMMQRWPAGGLAALALELEMQAAALAPVVAEMGGLEAIRAQIRAEEMPREAAVPAASPAADSASPAPIAASAVSFVPAVPPVVERIDLEPPQAPVEQHIDRPTIPHYELLHLEFAEPGASAAPPVRASTPRATKRTTRHFMAGELSLADLQARLTALTALFGPDATADISLEISQEEAP